MFNNEFFDNMVETWLTPLLAGGALPGGKGRKGAAPPDPPALRGMVSDISLSLLMNSGDLK